LELCILHSALCTLPSAFALHDVDVAAGAA